MQVDIEKKSDALIIGNGKSRLQFDLNKLGVLFTTYGCNALYRDYKPNYLIAMDSGIIDEIISHRGYLHSEFYTQKDNRIDRIRITQKLPINYVNNEKDTRDSGNTAINLACKHEHKTIYMIGFDYISLPGNKFNNVYAGTKCYGAGNHTHISHVEKWKQRLRHIVDKYPDIKFVRVVGNDFNLNLINDNFKEITVEEFKELTNEKL